MWKDPNSSVKELHVLEQWAWHLWLFRKQPLERGRIAEEGLQVAYTADGWPLSDGGYRYDGNNLMRVWHDVVMMVLAYVVEVASEVRLSKLVGLQLPYMLVTQLGK